MSEYLEDAWKEFERTGEICNAADGLLSYVSDLRKENQKLAQDKENAISLMSPSWKHAADKESDILTRFVTMANEQFEIRDRLAQDKAELVELLEYFYKQPVDKNKVWLSGHIANQHRALKLLEKHK